MINTHAWFMFKARAGLIQLPFLFLSVEFGANILL